MSHVRDSSDVIITLIGFYRLKIQTLKFRIDVVIMKNTELPRISIWVTKKPILVAGALFERNIKFLMKSEKMRTNNLIYIYNIILILYESGYLIDKVGIKWTKEKRKQSVKNETKMEDWAKMINKFSARGSFAKYFVFEHLFIINVIFIPIKVIY